MQDVANDRAARRGDDTDDFRQERQIFFPLGREQALGGEALAAILEDLQQRPDAGKRDRIDDELVFRAAGISRQPPGADDLHAVFGLDRQADRGLAPAHRIERGVGVLQHEIAMTRAVALEPRDLAAHPDMRKILLDRALQCQRQLGDGILRQVSSRGFAPGGRGVEWLIVHRPILPEPESKSDASAPNFPSSPAYGGRGLG